MNVNSDNLKKVTQYVKNSGRYLFNDFMREHHLEDGAMEHGDDTFYRCPFHLDESPSMSVNDKLHVYHCLSCGRHGNMIGFLAQYSTEIEGRSMSYTQKANELLKTDAIMQATLGFNTVYTSEINDELILEKRRYHFIKGTVYPHNYLELSTMMLEKHCTEQEIKLFVLMMQEGRSPQDIFDVLFEGKVTAPATAEIDINDLFKLEET